MKPTVIAAILGLLTSFSVSCAPAGSGTSRTLGHTYQDSRGLTFISLFDMGDVAQGTARTIGDNSSSRSLTLSREEFERLWSQLDEAEMSGFAVQNESQRFDAQNNYVIVKGTMPGGNTTTYVVPKAKASASLKSWIKAFRTRTQS